jgi:hypothetical protein
MRVTKQALNSFVILCVFGGTVWATDPSWYLGKTPPAGWSITPSIPGTGSVIHFSGPFYDIISDTHPVYGNPCLAESMMTGKPQLFIDTSTRMITLWFLGPAPQYCTKEYNPVSGIKGSFGPLSPGKWEFIGIHPRASFVLNFTVGQTSEVLYVDSSAPGPHDGSNWKRAYRHLQEALAVATTGMVVKVAEGIYYPDRGMGVGPDASMATFKLKDGVTLEGGYAGYEADNPDARDPRSYPTYLSGDLKQNDLWELANTQDNAYHVLSARQLVQTAVIDGFVVRDGNADGDYPAIYGGGLFIEDADVMVVDCVFQNNTGTNGGAIACLGGQLNLVNTDCSGNRAWGFGGAVFSLEGHLDLTNCLLSGNIAGYEAAGGAAIFNINGDVKIVNCTIADNPSPSGAALSGFGWGSPGMTVQIANSILHNGGNEIWSNQPEQIDVTHSDIQGGWSGTGNIQNDPLFISRGKFSIEGRWNHGDYQVKPGSPVINMGNTTALPPDIADIDRNGNTTEPIPLDLGLDTRVQDNRVDIGAYEQTAGGGNGGGNFTVWINGIPVTMIPDKDAPNPATSYIGCAPLQVSLNFKAELSVKVVPVSPAGGSWSGTITPSIVGPGVVNVTLCVRVSNIDTSKLPSNPNQKVAEVTLLAAPAL